LREEWDPGGGGKMGGVRETWTTPTFCRNKGKNRKKKFSGSAGKSRNQERGVKSETSVDGGGRVHPYPDDEEPQVEGSRGGSQRARALKTSPDSSGKNKEGKKEKKEKKEQMKNAR